MSTPAIPARASRAAGPGDRPAPPGDVPHALDAVSLVHALNELLEGERAGVRVARAFSAEHADVPAGEALKRIGRDEAWCCAMLVGHIERLGGRVSRKTGAFHEAALRREGLADRLDYLNRGQSWVVRRLRALMPAIADAKLAHDLGRMLVMHERNVARCGELAGGPPPADG